MEPLIEQAGEAVVGGVIQEAVAELTGRSNRKWAVILVAFLVGGFVAAYLIRSRTRAASVTPISPTPAPDAPV